MADTEGIQVEVVDDQVRIEFLNRARKGPTLEAIRRVGGGGNMKLDTGGTKRTYILPRHIAEAAGLVDAEAPAKAPRKSTAKAKPKPAAEPESGTGGDPDADPAGGQTESTK